MIENKSLIQFCKHNLSELYMYDLKKILDFLRKVANKPTDFDIKDEEAQEALPVIFKQLMSLCAPDGYNYNGPESRVLDPKQHIYRIWNKKWKPESSMSKFVVNRKWNHNGPPLGKTNGYEGNRIDLTYWSHYDLLGLFLSLMGPAPLGADKPRFFLPLTAVYGRWCWAIGGTRILGDETPPAEAGVGPPPFVYQCTWRERFDGVEYFLGASLGGYDWESSEAVATWKTELRKTRFNLLKDFNNIRNVTWTDKDKNQQGWGYEHSPRIDESGASSSHFGNCGETYPFLQMFANWSSGKKVRGSVAGLAIQRAFLGNSVLMQQYDQAAMTQNQIKENKKTKEKYIDYTFMWPPCSNCKHLLTVAKATIQRFECVWGLE